MQSSCRCKHCDRVFKHKGALPKHEVKCSKKSVKKISVKKKSASAGTRRVPRLFRKEQEALRARANLKAAIAGTYTIVDGAPAELRFLDLPLMLVAIGPSFEPRDRLRVMSKWRSGRRNNSSSAIWIGGETRPESAEALFRSSFPDLKGVSDVVKTSLLFGITCESYKDRSLIAVVAYSIDSAAKLATIKLLCVDSGCASSIAYGNFADGKAWAGRGFGQLLLHLIKSEAMAQGCDRLELQSSETAIGWYEKRGFTRSGTAVDGCTPMLVNLAGPTAPTSSPAREPEDLPSTHTHPGEHRGCRRRVSARLAARLTVFDTFPRRRRAWGGARRRIRMPFAPP